MRFVKPPPAVLRFQSALWRLRLNAELTANSLAGAPVVVTCGLLQKRWTGGALAARMRDRDALILALAAWCELTVTIVYCERPYTRPRFRSPPPHEVPRKPTSSLAEDLALLGLVSMPDDAAVLRGAWRAVAKRLHPDAGGHQARFIRARAAYERLLRAVSS